MTNRTRTNFRSHRRSRVGVALDAEYNPLTAIGWLSSFWASDPLWTSPGDGNAVSTWRSGGTNTVAVTQATGSKQPLYRASYANLNNRPAIDFDGTDDTLTNSFGATTFSPYTVICVAHWDTAANTQQAVGNNSAKYAAASGSAWRLAATTAVNGGSSSTGKHLHRAFINTGADDDLEVDGTMVITNGNAGDTGIGTLHIGQAANLTTDPFNGAVAFVGVLAADITLDAGWDAFKQWLRDFYAMTIA